jgi:hypothetical protein
MYDHDLDKKNSNRPGPRQQPKQPEHLLDELTSIKALLDSEQGADSEIPVLDDVVGFAASFTAVDAGSGPALLDLDGIFGDGPGSSDTGDFEPAAAHLAFPKFTLDVAVSDTPGESGAMVTPVRDPRAHLTRAALIQELVAEFLPQIETALRTRLEGLDDTALHALKKPD